MTVLGQGWQPRQSVTDLPAPLDPLSQVMVALEALREGVLNLPAPVVHVEAQDLSDVVTAVQGLNGPSGPSASDIAEAIREVLAPTTAREDPEVMRQMLEALERLDFRMKGVGVSGVGGTVATISEISNFVRTSPEPGYTWPVSGALTDAQLRATPVPVSGTVTATDARTLTERMIARAPATGYTLWLDVTSTSSTHIFIAEATAGTAASATGFRGIRLVLDASGNPLGGVGVNTSFVWNDRASATWST